MKPIQWTTYRTRFLSFTDHLGREHSGRRGDYLVESYDGVLSIAPRQIFEDIYVPITDDSNPAAENDQPSLLDGPVKAGNLNGVRVEPVRVERIKSERLQPRYAALSPAGSELSSRLRRKSPQPVRPSSSQASLM